MTLDEAGYPLLDGEVPVETEPDSTWLGPLLESRLAEYDEPLVVGATSGWIDLDEAINGSRGLLPGQFVIVAGRPGVGKSVLVIDWGRRLAASGITTQIMSLEMSKSEIGDRLLSSQAGVQHSRVAGHLLEPGEREALARQAANMADLPLRISDNPTVTLGSMRRTLDELTSGDGDLGVVVVDYLGLMSTHDPRLPRTEQVSIISRGLKLLAKEYGITVIAAAQLNRGPEQRPDKRPVLSDLRESGSLEQDCDIAILLHHPDEATNRLDAILAKNRNGPKLTIPLAFNAAVMRIENAYQGM